MDIKAYISSGILESYALGATTPQETAEVEANLAAFPELAEELAKIQNSLEEYAILHAQTPPDSLKERTRKAIFEAESQASPNKFTVEKNEASFPKTNQWRMAASWALLALSLGANYYFFSQWKNTEGKLTVAQAQNTQMAKNEAALRTNYSTKIAIMQNDNFKKILLKGTTDAPNAVASVYFNPKNHEVFITSINMPALTKGKQYQLWAIVNGKPIDAGLINEADSLGKMKLSPNAQAFAISLENQGGSTTEAGPKGAVMVVGNV